jgi:hypothetical protein
MNRTLRRLTPIFTLGLAITVALSVATPALAAPEPESQSRYDRRDNDRDRGWRNERGDRDHGRYDRRDDRYRRDDRHGSRYDDRRYDDRRYDDRRHDRGYNDRGNRRFAIPSRIHNHNDYRSYYHGRIYHREHRHYHVVYSFPVFYPSGLVYEPYAYCGESYFGGGAFYYDGPRLSIRWRF